jgi:hypothetical protein
MSAKATLVVSKGYEGGWLGQGLMRLLAEVAALAAEFDATLRCQNRPRQPKPPSQPALKVG